MLRHLPARRPPAPGRRATTPARPVLVAVLALALAGCGVRLETPPPAEPSPDAVEQVRARTVDDAAGLADAAARLVGTAPDDAARVVLQDVETFSRRHVEELGGVYDSGLPRPTGTPAPSPATDVTDLTSLLDELVEDAGTAADDADVVADGRLARLVASVSVARAELAVRLADATGAPLPERPATAEPDGDPATDGTPDDTADGPAAEDAPPDEAAGATPPADAEDPAVPSAAALALAHDEAAWTLTVLAARTTGDGRAALLAGAASHRAASDTWARAAGVAGRPADPRRAAYALPAGLDDPAVVETLRRTLEQAVADASATVVAEAPAGARRDAVDALRTATAAATARGAAPVPFPGMPELGTEPVG